MTAIKVTVSMEEWQYAFITGIAEVRGETFSSALRYLLKLSFAYLQRLIEEGAFEPEQEEKLRRLIELIREKKNK